MLIIWSAEFIFKDGLPFYKYVNRVLLNNEKTLLDIMPLIKVLNYVLSNEIIYDRTWPDEQVTVYRMLDLDTKTVNQMANKLCEKTGKIIRSTTYAACSLDKTQAQKFAKGKDSVLLIIQVPPLELAPHFKSLKEHSIYKDEMEVLFTCYSAFKVEKVVREVGKCEVILTAVDNVNRHENKDDDWLCSF